MIRPRISKFILVLISGLLTFSSLLAQDDNTKSAPPAQERQRGIQFSSDKKTVEAPPAKLFQGFSVGFDLAGAGMYAAANYGQIEGQLHINLKERFFPVFEIGLGHSNHTADETGLHFKTDAPYFRIGCDYNFNKDLTSKNRIYGGIRYAYTNFNFDLDGPGLTDDVWGGTVPYSFKGQNSSASWFELVFGLEAKIWGNFHVGWTARYHRRLSQKIPAVGQAWYIPGFGKNDSHNFGGTFNLIFDI